MEPKRGLFAGGGTTVRLPRQIAFPAAMEFLLTAEAFPADAGARAGPAQRDRRRRRAARPGPASGPRRITANAPLAVQATKESVLRGLAVDLRRGVQDRERAGRQVFSQRGRQGGPEGVRREARAELAGPVSVSVDPRTPCLIGVGPAHVATRATGPSPEPLELWDEVVPRRPRTRRRRRRDVLGALDSLQIVYCQTWQYDDPVGRLADALGIDPRHRLYSGIGGTTPQVLVQDAAARDPRAASSTSP